MKHLWIIIFSIISFTTVNSQDGLWEYAWQNNDNNLCAPQLIFITTTSDNQGTISYEYGWHAYYDLCSKSVEYRFSRNITYNSEENVWEDTDGQQISYNTDTNIITFSLNGKSVWYQPNEIISADMIYNKDKFVYEDSNGNEVHEYHYVDGTHIVTFPSREKSILYRSGETNIPFQFIEGTFGGYWIKQSELNDIGDCCHPDLIYMVTSRSYSQERELLKLIYNASYTTQSHCSEDTTNKMFYPFDSNSTTINFVDDLVNPTTNISFTPSITDNVFTLFSNTDGLCSSTYKRSSNFTAINGIWTRDGEIELGPMNYYRVEVISNKNVQYMRSEYAKGCIVYTGFVIQTPEGTYYDTSLEDTFTYNPSLDTIRFNNEKNVVFSNRDNKPSLINWIYGRIMHVISYVKPFSYLYDLYKLVFG